MKIWHKLESLVETSGDSPSKIVLGTGLLGLIVSMNSVQTRIRPKHAKKLWVSEWSKNRPNPSLAEKEGLGRSGIKERNILDPKSFLY